MAIHLNLSSLKKDGDKKDATLHWMPCTVKSDGEAKVSTYFEPMITSQKDGTLKASFRGYPLLGKEVNIPKNYCGIVLQESNTPLSEEAERKVYATHSFNKFVYWNWDSEPSGEDKIISALEWIDIAEAVSRMPFARN